jgi:hypothetical protein
LLFNSISLITGKGFARKIPSHKLIAHAKHGFDQIIQASTAASAAASAAVYSLTHRTVLNLGYAISEVNPCALTGITLPLYQLLAVAQLAEARLDLAVAFGKPSRSCLDPLSYVVFLSLSLSSELLER